jgi:hypothetical protein
MANKERGEMLLVAGNQTYTLRLTTNACCEVEDRSGKLFDDVMVGVKKGSFSSLRWFLWAALQEHHADTVKTPKDAGSILDAAGGIVGLIDQMQAFIALNEPPASDERGGTDQGAPPTRPPDAHLAVSGADSISTPALSG